MTVTSKTNTATFNGNGSTTVFPFTFRFFADTDLVAVKISAEGSSQKLSLNVDYTVQGANDLDGGSITITHPILQNGETLVIKRVLPLVQNTDIRNQGAFFPELHEDEFDYLTMLIQQTNNEAGNALKLTDSGDRWDAEDHRIIRVANPVDNQDAVTKLWTQKYVGSIIGNGSGSINSASKVAYKGVDGTPYTVQEMSDNSDPSLGASLIGYKKSTVAQAIDQLEKKPAGRAFLESREPFRRTRITTTQAISSPGFCRLRKAALEQARRQRPASISGRAFPPRQAAKRALRCPTGGKTTTPA